MESDKNLQNMVEKDPIILNYAKQESKRDWKKIAVYGAIVSCGVIVAGCYALKLLREYSDMSINFPSVGF